MTRDVFKYFKHVRSLQEDKGAEKAAELGYQHQARGVYIDPKTQKRYKNVGDKLEPIVVEPTAEKGGGQQKPDTKSLGQFKKDATTTQPEAQPTALPQIPDGVSDDEFAAAKAKEFTGGRDVTPERKEFLDKVSKTLVALGNRQAAAEVSDEEEPETPEETEAPEEKTADDFPTIDQKLEQESEEATEENDLDEDEAFETEYERFQQEAEETMRGLADRQRKMMEKKFGKFTESLKNIPSATDKKSFLASMAHAKTFEGRVNAGAGKNNLGYADVQNLMANRDRLIEGYGDGSPEHIKKFVDSVRSIEVSDEFVDASYDVLPETFKKSLKGKGQVTGDKYVSDDKAHKDMHYLGKNPDGTAKRGMASTNDRAKLMWKIYLEQGGRDAYTGLPLDIQSMDLEHVRGFNNKDGGKPGKEEWEQRENDDNMTLINSNINQTKVDLSMKDFFEQRVDPDKDKSEEDFGGIEKLFDKQNEIMSVGEELSKTLLGEGGKGLGNEVTREVLREHFSGDDTRYNDLREEFRKVATDEKDKKKANGMKSKMGKTLLKATGLARGITDPSGRRTVALQENVYRGFLESMAGAKSSDRQKYMDGWAEAIKAGNDERTPKAVNRKLIELGLIDQEILDDKKAGRVFREELEYLDRMNGRNTIERLKKSLRNPV
jgi:hypothetical protein